MTTRRALIGFVAVVCCVVLLVGVAFGAAAVLHLAAGESQTVDCPNKINVEPVDPKTVTLNCGTTTTLPPTTTTTTLPPTTTTSTTTTLPPTTTTTTTTLPPTTTTTSTTTTTTPPTTTTTLPQSVDLIVTVASPSSAATGSNVVFTATVKNQGTKATPAGTIVDAAFFIDGTTVAWSDTSTAALAPSATRVLTANSGPNGVAFWTATSGVHNLSVTVNSINRIAESTTANNTLAGTITVSQAFPAVFHHGGAQHVLTPAEVTEAANLGIDLSMNYGPVTGALATAMTNSGMKYLDRRITDMIYAVCPPGSGCTLTTAQENSLVAQVTTYLNANKNDPLIAGYYILDDWPGNVANALKRITAAAHAVGTKPTVCAFVGILDFWPNADHSSQPYQDHSAFDRGMVNYSPQGCDLADFYVYGIPGSIGEGIGCVPNSNVDWSGQYFIPYMKAALTARGWTPSMGFQIAPQTFTLGTGNCATDYPEPNAASIQQQTTAFCQAGATSTLAYIYDQFGQGKYLANQVNWRTGYANGLAACRAIWGI